MHKCFVFDLDGTVTTQELLPLIAGALDLEKEMKLLTELTINGQIPFEDSFRLRCACLRSAPLNDIREIVQTVLLSAEIEKFIKDNLPNCYIITGNLDVWIKPLLDRLGCGYYCSTATIKDNMLLRVDSVLHKSHPVLELRKKFDKVIAIGDGVNDMPMFDAADVCIAYGGVHPPAKPLVEMSDYVVFDERALCRLLNTL